MDDSGVMVVDLGPVGDMEVIRRLRAWTQAPIIVLSGQASGACRGARARCGQAAGPVRIGDTMVDLRSKRITRRQQEVRLTPTEWHLLEVLLRAPGRLLSQQQLLAAVWGPGYDRAAGNLRLYMAQLRRKLEPDPSRPRWLVTEPGLGYRFQPGPRDSAESRTWRYRPAPVSERHQCCRIRPRLMA